MERVLVAVDVANLFKSCKEEFGTDARVDFQILSAMVPALRHPGRVQQKLNAYIVAGPKQNHHGFANVLRSFGYMVRERQMRYEKGVRASCECGRQLVVPQATRSDWDVGITVDVLACTDDYDTFVLVSGDGDFAILLEHLRVRGKKTMVLSFETATSRSLYDVADELHTFGRNILHTAAAVHGGT